jgi:ADP-heptose:LPS heptosyltransferase
MKILVVRFSSIGDIVLTSPVVRCIHQQIPNAEIHFITKKSFESIVATNPFIHKTWAIEKSIDELIPQLKAKKFDFLVDLHTNIRTKNLIRKLGVPHASFPKLNIEKWLLVNFKIPMKTNVHVVERYFKAVEKLHVVNDHLPCDFFFQTEDEIDVASLGVESKKFVAFAIGAQFATKRMPISKMIEVMEQIQFPVVLSGGPMDKETADDIIKALPNQQIVNACGEFSLRQSASIVKQSAVLLTHDTGLMHIASAFQIPIVSVWGNTVPALGMYPYYPQDKNGFSIHEVADLKCRPCSKIGFKTCPKKHFNCMNLQDAIAIANDVNVNVKFSSVTILH